MTDESTRIDWRLHSSKSVVPTLKVSPSTVFGALKFHFGKHSSSEVPVYWLGTVNFSTPNLKQVSEDGTARPEPADVGAKFYFNSSNITICDPTS